MHIRFTGLMPHTEHFTCVNAEGVAVAIEVRYCTKRSVLARTPHLLVYRTMEAPSCFQCA